MSKNKSGASNPVPKFIIYIAKILEFVAPKLAISFAAKLFITPIKYKVPKREIHMDNNSQQNPLYLDKLDKTIQIYQYGSGEKKVLLVHGWSGRGTQLVKIADSLVQRGFSIISFDAPAHGKSSGKTSIMTEFIYAIQEVDKIYGPFEYSIGHSLGGMSILNAVRLGFKTNKIVTVGAGDIIQDIIDDFTKKIGLKNDFGMLLCKHFEKKFSDKMDNYSAYKSVQVCPFPLLIIHDKHDEDVSVKAAYHLAKHSKQAELFITSELGHRKILGDKSVIQKINQFLN